MKHLKHRSNNPLAAHLPTLGKTLFLLFTLLMSVSAYGQMITFRGCTTSLSLQNYTLNQTAIDTTGRNQYATTPLDWTQSCSAGNCELFIEWNNGQNRWELLLNNNGPSFSRHLLYTNSSASTPNPPDLTLGTWVDVSTAAGGNCGGNLTSANSTLTGSGVQNNVSQRPSGTITVNHTGDTTANDSHCTLREAVALAHDHSVNSLNGCTRVAYSGGTARSYDTVNFATSFINPQTITLGGSGIDITTSVMIDGSQRAVTVDANRQSTIFYIIGASAEATIDHLRLINGNTRYYGGAISATAGRLTVSNSTLSDNTASVGGGAISSGSATVNVSNSTLSGNEAGDGGAISAITAGGGVPSVRVSNSTLSGNTATRGGAISATAGRLTVHNSTLSGNTSNSDGGAIFAQNVTLTVSNSTLSGNTAVYGGGAVEGSNARVTVNSSVLLGNTARRSNNCKFIRVRATGANNLWEAGATCGAATGTTTTLTAVLETDNSGKAKLADNGCVTPAADGCVKTIALLPPSNPAIDAGTGTDPDQRGIAVYNGRRDIGAYEYVPVVNGVCGTANGTATLTAPLANLCGAGTASSVTTGTSTFTWSCNGANGGNTASCSAPRQFTVSANASGGNGSITPASRTVNHGATTTFTVAPNAGYTASVTGCGGGLSNNSYTTGAITAACTVSATFTAVPQNLRYDGNGNTSGTAPTNSTPATGATVTVAGVGSLVKAGYSFAGWNTVANGSGTSYAASDTFAMPPNSVTLYAQWTANAQTLSYDGNGNTGGTAPANSTPATGATVTVAGVGSLVKAGYSFAGWNTAANGNGTSYVANDTFNMPPNSVTLYAQWRANAQTLSYDGNGNTSGTAPANSTPTTGATVTVAGVGSLVKAGYSFAGWNTAANGSGTSYAANDTFNMPPNSVTLYAQWRANAQTLSYDGNGNTGGAAPANSTPATGATVTVAGVGSLVKAGYSFAGWNTAANGSGTSYVANDTFAMPPNSVTLYAQWRANAQTLSYDGNGSTGGTAPANSTPATGATVTVAGVGGLVKAGYSFAGWNTAANGSGTGYVASDTFAMPPNSVTLYAQWAANAQTLSYDGNGNTSGTKPADATHQTDSTATVADNTGNLERTGYTFVGWNTAANGSGTSYAVNDTFVMPPNSVTLYAQWSTGSQSLRYDSNSSDSGSVPAGGSYATAALITVSNNTGNLTRMGYTFVGWNTAADGNGTSYAVGNTFRMPAKNVTLYAQWSTGSQSLRYDGNDNSSGSVPTGGSFATNASITVSSNSGNLARTGYSFAGWNTAANGSGTSYAVNVTFAMPATNVTLYAQWTANAQTLSYDGNGNTGGTAPANSTPATGVTVTVAGVGSLVKAGYSFAGWNTAANGNGTSYVANDTFNMPPNSVTLYAQWRANAQTLSYDGNGNTSGTAPANSTPATGATVTVAGVGSLVKAGYRFVGWNTAANGSGTSYAANDTFNMPPNSVTLYAQWRANAQTLSYDGNGSSGGTAPANSIPATGATVTVAGVGSLVKAGYSFAGWNTAANGSGTGYVANDTFNMPPNSVTLYAQWTANAQTLSYDGNGNTGGTKPADATHQTDSTATVADNTGNLERTGYTFVGWNTAANGSGTSYAVNDTFVMPPNAVTLYAQWSTGSQSLRYDSNSSDSGSVPAGGSYATATVITVSNNTGNLTRMGYTFVGWNTAADGSGTSYAVGNTFPMPAKNVTLYAQWSTGSQSLRYDGNDNSSGSVPTGGSFATNTSITVSSNSGNLARTGYSFAGWNTAANGSGTSYAVNVTFAMPATNVTLYAQWTANAQTLSYDGNGSTGGTAPANSTPATGATVTVAGVGSLVKAGYSFAGWNTVANGSGTSYAVNDTFNMPPNSVTLYAQWTLNSYTVTGTAGANGGITPASRTVNHGDTTTFTVTPDVGYTASVSGCSGSLIGNTYTTDVITVACTVSANFVAVVNASCGSANGTATLTAPSTDLCTAGTASSVTVGASAFTWTCDGANTGSSASCSAPRQYTLSYNTNGGNTIASVTASAGTLVNLPTPTRVGFTFDGWHLSGTAVASSFTMPSAATTLTAQWRAITVTPVRKVPSLSTLAMVMLGVLLGVFGVRKRRKWG